MKNKISSLIIAILFAGLLSLSAHASYYFDDGSNEDNPNVDKFKPTSGVKIKESNIAGWMENTTRNAMNGNKNSKSNNKTTKTQNRNTNKNGTYTKSYKWF